MAENPHPNPSPQGRGFDWIANGRFKGGWTTRHYGAPEKGVHAVQMELAQRGYMDEPAAIDEANWPGQLHTQPAIHFTLKALISACLTFAEGTPA
jgi:formiminoglutamase